MPVILISLMMGVFSYTGPDFITMSAPPFRIKMEDNISFGLMALYTASLMVPRLISRSVFTLFCHKVICRKYEFVVRITVWYEYVVWVYEFVVRMYAKILINSYSTLAEDYLIVFPSIILFKFNC